MQRSRSRLFQSALLHLAAGLALWGLTHSPAHAQGRLDGPAQAKIDEAINVHYLATDFAKAEQLLTGTVDACGNQCSAPIIAKAWMYVGIVRGAGNSDLRGAKEAFKNAIAVYPGVTLDNDLAPTEVQTVFADAKAQGGSSPAATPAAAPPPPVVEEAPPPPPPPVTYPPMQCEPKVQEVQTRRPVPVSCSTQYPTVTKSTLYVKAFGEDTYTRVPMKRSGNAWQAEVPCGATNMGATVSWYVEAGDAKGARLDGYGTADGPVDIMLNDAAAEPPPHFPGKPAPDRCPDLADCPPEMLGTPACPGTTKPSAEPEDEGGKSWGDTCSEHSECQSGLACLSGTCETAPSCSSDTECGEGRCDVTGGTCVYNRDDASEASYSPGPTNMVSLTMGFDLAFMSGSAVCDPAENPGYSCYRSGKPYYLASTPDGVNPTQYLAPDGQVRPRYADGGSAPGIGLGTIRILLAYDRMLTENISGGVNAGIALTPIPDGALGVHFDVHGKYWFSGNGPGLKPFVGAAFGLGRVDGMGTVSVVETAYEDTNYRFQQQGSAGNPATSRPANGTAFASGECRQPTTLADEFCQLPVEAARSYGNLFVGVGVGAWLNLGGHGPKLELYGKVMLPETGVSVQPALSYVYGF